MLKLTNKKKGIRSLEITEIILNIHNDIEFFLKSNNYSITKQHWDMKLSHLWIQRLSGFIPQIYIIVIIVVLLNIIPIFDQILKSPPTSAFLYLLVLIITIISIPIKLFIYYFKK